MTRTIWIGVDVGGTFTDAVAYDPRERELRWAKVPSSAEHPASSVLDAIANLTGDAAEIDHFVHGITIGTNAIIERTGADVWVVTTLGFRDTLEIARTERRELYNIKTLKPEPLVPRTRILEADERLRFDGSVVRALTQFEIDRVADELVRAQTQSIAVCFLHSFANDAHEREMTAALAEHLPGAFICSSSGVLPEFREYERFSTTVLNAYLGPLMSRYLGALQGSMRDRGFRRTVFLMTSNGGMMSAQRAQQYPVQTVLSGPAGGVAAAVHLGREIGARNLITYDMGGTSTDVCLIEDLLAPLTTEQVVAGFANRTPQIEIATIGAGGGSIAWLDDGDILKVGPRSAGANPGPAAYGLGGTEPTVTDANLRLGRLHADTPLAERLHLSDGPARMALSRLSERMSGLSDLELADGIIRIAVARMVSAIKEISIAKGYDPRDFALLAYGGAGPMHAAYIADELDIAHVIVPPSPGNFSAFGCLVSDLQHTNVRTHLLETRRDEWREVERVFDELEEQGRAEMLEEGVEAARIASRRELGMRYLGQSWELVVPIDPDVASMPDLERLFNGAHEKRFGHKLDEPMQIVTVRVVTLGRMDKPALGSSGATPAATARCVGSREVYFDGRYRTTAVYARDGVPRDRAVKGPALVEEMGALTVVPPSWALSVGKLGEFHLSRES
ncbi:MAG: hydantoinase/oxoprolinase family protein [Gammaproteobacteria bacterium]|nr:hydantoinase/oxoprolinase family protein [Gammaproteobacteria bacterium]